MELAGIGRGLMLLGGVLLAVGALVAWGPRLPWIGRLPGDLVIGGGGWKLYLPLGTSFLLSVIVSLVLWLFQRR